MVLDSPPSPPPPAVLSAKRRRGGGAAEADASPAAEDSSPDVVVVGEHRCGARGGGVGGWGGAASSSAPLAGRRPGPSRGGWLGGGVEWTAALHAPVAAVVAPVGGGGGRRSRWPASVSPVTDQDFGALGAATAAAPRDPSRSTGLRPQRATGGGGGGGSSASPAASATVGDAVEAISVDSPPRARSFSATAGRRGHVRDDVVDVSSSPPLPAALRDDPLGGRLPAPLPAAAVGPPASFRPRDAQRRTTAAAAAARQVADDVVVVARAAARHVADDEPVARSLEAEMAGALGPDSGGPGSCAVGPAAAAGGGGERVHPAAASWQRRPLNAAAWGSLVPAGLGGAGAAAAPAGAPGLALRAAQMRGRPVAGPAHLRGPRSRAAMEMALAIARESAWAGGSGFGDGGYDGSGHGPMGGGGNGHGHAGGGGGFGGGGGGGWPPLVREGEDEYTALLRLDDAVDSERHACPPHVLARLPTTTVGQDGERGIGAGGSSSCCICMDPIVAGDVVRRLPCCHLYHSRCIDQWLGVKGVCPVDQRVVKDMVGA